jgi:hypothetical protein
MYFITLIHKVLKLDQNIFLLGGNNKTFLLVNICWCFLLLLFVFLFPFSLSFSFSNSWPFLLLCCLQKSVLFWFEVWTGRSAILEFWIFRRFLSRNCQELEKKRDREKGERKGERRGRKRCRIRWVWMKWKDYFDKRINNVYLLKRDDIGNDVFCIGYYGETKYEL